MTEKLCGQCKIVKPIDQFSISRQGVRGPVLRTTCKECGARKMRHWAKDNPERNALRVFKYNLRTRYGMTFADYEAMLIKQDNKCAICHTTEETKLGPNGTLVRMSVDHCHTSGKVRGLLCNRCNRALGLLGDSVDLLQKAIVYLKE